MEYIFVTVVIVAIILGAIAYRNRHPDKGGMGKPRGPSDTPVNR